MVKKAFQNESHIRIWHTSLTIHPTSYLQKLSDSDNIRIWTVSHQYLACTTNRQPPDEGYAEFFASATNMDAGTKSVIKH